MLHKITNNSTNMPNLLFIQMWSHRKAEHLAMDQFADRKTSLLETQLGICRLQVRRDRIVYQASDALCG